MVGLSFLIQDGVADDQSSNLHRPHLPRYGRKSASCFPSHRAPQSAKQDAKNVNLRLITWELASSGDWKDTRSCVDNTLVKVSVK